MFCFSVPEAPAAIKALVMSAESILVSWKPPTQPNGLVIQYTVYIREDSVEAKEVSSFVYFQIALYYVYFYPLSNDRINWQTLFDRKGFFW